MDLGEGELCVDVGGVVGMLLHEGGEPVKGVWVALGGEVETAEVAEIGKVFRAGIVLGEGLFEGGEGGGIVAPQGGDGGVEEIARGRLTATLLGESGEVPGRLRESAGKVGARADREVETLAQVGAQISGGEGGRIGQTQARLDFQCGIGGGGGEGVQIRVARRGVAEEDDLKEAGDLFAGVGGRFPPGLEPLGESGRSFPLEEGFEKEKTLSRLLRCGREIEEGEDTGDGALAVTALPLQGAAEPGEGKALRCPLGIGGVGFLEKGQGLLRATGGGRDLGEAESFLGRGRLDRGGDEVEGGLALAAAGEADGSVEEGRGRSDRHSGEVELVKLGGLGKPLLDLERGGDPVTGGRGREESLLCLEPDHGLGRGAVFDERLKESCRDEVSLGTGGLALLKEIPAGAEMGHGGAEAFVGEGLTAFAEGDEIGETFLSPGRGNEGKRERQRQPKKQSLSGASRAHARLLRFT